MNDFIKNLSSVYWWLSVVFVGIAINLFSALFKDKLDSFFTKTSTWWKNKSEKRKSEFESAVKRLTGNPHIQMMVSFEGIRSKMMSIHMLLMTIVFFIFGISIELLSPHPLFSHLFDKIFQLVCYFMGTLCLIVSWRYSFNAHNISDQISHAIKNDEKQNIT